MGQNRSNFEPLHLENDKSFKKALLNNSCLEKGSQQNALLIFFLNRPH